MIVKIKCACLKEGIDPIVLADHGFTVNEVGNWIRKCGDGFIAYYPDTKRFAARWINGWRKRTSYRFLKKYIQDLIHFDIIGTKYVHECWVIFGNYHYWSEEKMERINKELDRRDKKCG